jgi:hypothetical protein
MPADRPPAPAAGRRRRPHPARRARRFLGGASVLAALGLGGVMAVDGAATTQVVATGSAASTASSAASTASSSHGTSRQAVVATPATTATTSSHGS